MLHATYEGAERQDAHAENGAAGSLPAPSITEFISGAKRVAERQGEIWITQAKAAVLRAGIAAGLMLAAAALMAVGLVFLLIGLYRILTDVLHIAPVWSSLIFAAACILFAFGAMVPVIFRRRKKREKHKLKDGRA
jgi:hypothetical protein